MSMVDIVKVELAGPCKSKFSLLTSSLTEIIGYIDSQLGFGNLY